MYMIIEKEASTRKRTQFVGHATTTHAGFGR